MKATRGTSIWFMALFWSLPILYFLLYGRHGFATTDQGFIQALSWRLLCGQVPYVDFFYVRPPLSPWLHALELRFFPENHAILISRFIFYSFMALSVWFATLTLKKIFSPERFPFNWYLFACLAFVFSVHNYPPMPWHTVDGILFSSLGFYLLTRGPHKYWLAFGMLALFLAALTKQPFYLAPVSGLIWVGLQPQENSAARKWPLGLALLVGYGLIFLGIMWLIHPKMPAGFLAQTTGSTSIYDLFAAGMIPYLKPGFVLLAVIIGRFVQKRFYPEATWMLVGLKALIWIFVAVAIGMTTFKTFLYQEFQPPLYAWPQLLFLTAFYWSLRYLAEKRKEASIVLALLAISWAGGISWGYALPILFFAPALAGTLLFSQDVLKQVFQYTHGLVLLGFGLAAFWWLYQFPYNDKPRAQISQDLGMVYPRLSGIQSEVSYSQLTDFKKHHRPVAGPFMVMPAHPLIHYLENEYPPGIADWVHNGELNWKKNEVEILERLSKEVRTVYLEKKKLAELEDKGKYGAELAKYVKKKWDLRQETGYFLVYRNPEFEKN